MDPARCQLAVYYYIYDFSPSCKRMEYKHQPIPGVPDPATAMQSATIHSSETLRVRTEQLDSGNQRESKTSPADTPCSTPVHTPRKHPAEPLEPPGLYKRIRRDESVKKACRERNSSYIITKIPVEFCDIAHLYPFSLKHKDR
ncbi:hypothetical protein ASPFODRAFT_620164 [Aspergillus luchuensis CBS 106.47]|uniref:Uncharacterized protein n=1 Tax=Aspergillus luchuensis (strain CBS 106.47) TaxID=1137211 RepID=A0A1M3TFN2_ASPLC|nr:hypothetical protein ASPFODRAFT_620164 [Aspergillus luchuensis CBS 106.47]